MSANYKDIGDDEIRVLGGKAGNSTHKTVTYAPTPRPSPAPEPTHKTNIVKPIAIMAGVLGLIFVFWYMGLKPSRAVKDLTAPEPGYYDPVVPPSAPSSDMIPLARAKDIGHGFVEFTDTVINDIPLRLNIPHEMRFSLHVGAIDRNDPSILFATQAADVRADNGGIVGAFVMKGEPLAWGRSKKGFCAIINDTVTVGVAENSPLFEEATEKEGYFFRQFPLVDNGQIVENELKGKNLRRALCDRNGEIFIVETLTAESLHDFAQALADLGVDHAVYLVGGIAYGWATDATGQRHEFGNPDPPKKQWENISYLVMRSKN